MRLARRWCRAFCFCTPTHAHIYTWTQVIFFFNKSVCSCVGVCVGMCVRGIVWVCMYICRCAYIHVYTYEMICSDYSNRENAKSHAHTYAHPRAHIHSIAQSTAHTRTYSIHTHPQPHTHTQHANAPDSFTNSVCDMPHERAQTHSRKTHTLVHARTHARSLAGTQTHTLTSCHCWSKLVRVTQLPFVCVTWRIYNYVVTHLLVTNDTCWFLPRSPISVILLSFIIGTTWLFYTCAKPHS